jgi:ribosomal protein L15E
MNMANVEFLWASEEINAHANEYWLRVMDIARRFNVPRVRNPSMYDRADKLSQQPGVCRSPAAAP